MASIITDDDYRKIQRAITFGVFRGLFLYGCVFIVLWLIYIGATGGLDPGPQPDLPIYTSPPGLSDLLSNP